MDCAGLADAYLIGMSEGLSFDAAVERRFQEYVEDPCAVVGNDARRRGLSDYMTGLLLPGDRSLRHRIARMIMRKLDRCPYCAKPHIASQENDNGTLPKMP